MLQANSNCQLVIYGGYAGTRTREGCNGHGATSADEGGEALASG